MSRFCSSEMGILVWYGIYQKEKRTAVFLVGDSFCFVSRVLIALDMI